MYQYMYVQVHSGIRSTNTGQYAYEYTRIVGTIVFITRETKIGEKVLPLGRYRLKFLQAKIDSKLCDFTNKAKISCLILT